MITQQAWMFTSIYEALRIKLKSSSIVTLVQLGARAFEEISGEVVQTASFVIRNTYGNNYCGTYMDLTEAESEKAKEEAFLSYDKLFSTKYSDFDGVPNTSMAYWLSSQALKMFKSDKLGTKATTREGMTTADNDRFLRGWHEVEFGKIGFGIKTTEESIHTGLKWYPYNKGGTNRRWYGNNDLVVNWYNDGSEIRNIKDPKTGRIRSHNYNAEYSFRESGTWTAICSGDIMVRYSEPGALFDSKGASVFAQNNDTLLYIIGLLNTKVSSVYLKVLSPAYEYKVGHVANVPVIWTRSTEVIKLVQESIAISKNDWDSYETSWDFLSHPLINRHGGKIYRSWDHDNLVVESSDEIKKWDYLLSTSFESWAKECEHRFAQLKANEEELNRIFIDIYGLQDELTPDVDDKDVTVRKADLKRDIKSLISYAVGCMFGRYSLDVPGLAYAGGEWDESKYTTFKADKDSIIPICDDEYFADDIVGRFIRFIEVAFGKATLNENLRFIAEALGGSGQPKEVIRNYFLNDFYADHLKIYQKRPIYWLFDSGKKGGFKALVYMHRYQPDTIARMRTDYVHEQQARYRTAIADLEQRIASASTSERVKLSKRLKTLQEQATEIQRYEEKIHHLADQYIAIDLDDGVKKNYTIFGDVLAKIK